MWQSPTALLCPLRGIEARSPAGRRKKPAADRFLLQGITRQPGSGACAYRPSGAEVAAQRKAASLTDQGVSALAAESVYVPRFFSLDFFHRG